MHERETAFIQDILFRLHCWTSAIGVVECLVHKDLLLIQQPYRRTEMIMKSSNWSAQLTDHELYAVKNKAEPD